MIAPPSIPRGFLDRWCTTLATGSESPPGAFLPTGLAMLSAIAGPRLVMRWNVAHEERCNLWILNVGASALARKTSGLAGLRAAVKWADTDDLRLLNIARISDAGLVQSLDVVGPDTANATKTADDPTNVDPVIRPVPVSWIATFNEVAPVWIEDGPGWAMDAQRTMLAIYDGQLGSTTRATSVPHQETFVTAVGNIPPGVLREHTTLGMLSSGFVGRWLTIPTPPPDSIVSFPDLNGGDPLAPLRRDIARLLDVTRGKARHHINPMWTSDARYMRHEWYRGWRTKLEAADPDDPFTIAAAELFGRQQATAVKVATLLALSHQYDHIDNLDEIAVTCDEVAWAQDVIDASISYITDTLRSEGADSHTPKGKIEGRVLRYLERAHARTAETARTYTQIADACKNARASRDDVTKAVDGLFASGHVEQAIQGRTRKAWLVGGDTTPQDGDNRSADGDNGDMGTRGHGV